MSHHGGYLLDQSFALFCQLGREIDCVLNIHTSCDMPILKMRHSLAMNCLYLARLSHSLLLKCYLLPIQMLNLQGKTSPSISGICITVL